MNNYTENEMRAMVERNRQAEFGKGYRRGLLSGVFATLCAMIIILAAAYLLVLKG